MIPANRFTVQINTDLAISWLADERNNTIEMSQDIRDLTRKCDQINERIWKDEQIERDEIMLEMFQEIVDSPTSIPRCRDASISAIRVITKRMIKNA